MLKRSDSDVPRDDDQSIDDAGVEDERVAAVWDAIERGAIDEALELAHGLDEDPRDVAAGLAIAVAHLEADDPHEAHRRLTGLGELDLTRDDEHSRRFYQAVAAYGIGEPQEGVDLLRGLDPLDDLEAADIHWWIGHCLDHLGEVEAADHAFAEAVRLAPDVYPTPIAISADDVTTIVESIVSRMPEKLAATFEELPVVVQDLPSLDLVRSAHGAVRPDTLGLYAGANLLEQSVMYFSGLPPTIYIYRRNLERFVSDREELEEEIQTTLLHELGHHLGYDEDDLDAIGLA